MPKALIFPERFKLYFQELINVRVRATNVIGESEISDPLFVDAGLTSIDFGDQSTWTNVFSIDETKEV